jgi:hypothetical protein
VVIARGDHGGRIATWPAEVSVLAPDGDDWPAVAATLAGKRLNAASATDATVDRWRTGVRIFRLAPAGDELLPSSDASQARPVTGAVRGSLREPPGQRSR